MIIPIRLFALGGLLLLAMPATAQTYYQGPGSYQRYGDTVYGPGGSSQQTYGNRTTVSTPDGSTTYSRYGNMTYGSDGTSMQTYGNITYGSDGTTIQKAGNQTYIHGPDGRMKACSTYGSQTYCN